MGGTIGLLFWLPFIQGSAGLYHLGTVRPEWLGQGDRVADVGVERERVTEGRIGLLA